MGKILTWKDDDISIGAYTFHDRKKPCLCIQKGNRIVKYGQFNDTESADIFMDELGVLLGAKMIDGEAGEDDTN